MFKDFFAQPGIVARYRAVPPGLDPGLRKKLAQARHLGLQRQRVPRLLRLLDRHKPLPTRRLEPRPAAQRASTSAHFNSSARASAASARSRASLYRRRQSGGTDTHAASATAGTRAAPGSPSAMGLDHSQNRDPLPVPTPPHTPTTERLRVRNFVAVHPFRGASVSPPLRDSSRFSLRSQQPFPDQSPHKHHLPLIIGAIW